MPRYKLTPADLETCAFSVRDHENWSEVQRARIIAIHRDALKKHPGGRSGALRRECLRLLGEVE